LSYGPKKTTDQRQTFPISSGRSKQLSYGPRRSSGF